MPEFIFGQWSILEAVRGGKRDIEALLLTDKVEERGTIAEIIQMMKERGVPVQRVPRRILDDIAQEGKHQNMALRVSPFKYSSIEDVLAVSQTRGEKPFLLLLDLLKDPQNVGVLLRVADAVGVHGVIIQERRSVGITPAVVSASSGAVEHLNIVMVTNLVNTMKDLKQQDIWLVGLDIGPNIAPIDRANLDMSLGLVLGSEGEGMRRLVRDTCDLLVTLPMRGKVASLNVATVGSVALYSAWQARSWQGWVHAK